MKYEINPDKAAILIRGKLGMIRMPQKRLADAVGLNRMFVNQFLIRKIDLRPHDIAKILKELDLEKAICKLSVPTNIK